MSLDFSGASAALSIVLRNHLAGMVQSIDQEDVLEVAVMADEATRYGMLAAQGDEQAKKNLEHLESQVLGFAVRKGFQEHERFIASLMEGLKIGGEVLGVLITGAFGVVRPA